MMLFPWRLQDDTLLRMLRLQLYIHLGVTCGTPEMTWLNENSHMIKRSQWPVSPRLRLRPLQGNERSAAMHQAEESSVK